MNKVLRAASLVILLTLALLTAAACNPAKESEKVAPPSAKIPITSSSEEAIELYKEARDLVDNLHRSEGYKLYAAAAEKDPSFALAYLGMAQTSPTIQEFYSFLEQAVALVDGVSPGERLMILGQQATVLREPETQKKYYEQLVEAYPDDERARILLALLHMRRGDNDTTIFHLNEAIRINPDFHPAQSLVGYAHKAAGNHAAAETAFKKSIELLPEEANPYDSYAEFLMKMGRFEEATQNYQLALSKDPNFFFSALGLGNSQAFLGRHEEARATLQDLHDRVGTDGQKRQALFWITASYLQEQKYDEALAEVQKQTAIAASTDDQVAISDDHLLMGTILIAAGRADEAASRFQEAVEILERTEIDENVKEATRRNGLYHQARVALLRGDLETAERLTATYGEAVAEKKLPNEEYRVHELAGRIALQREDYDVATQELFEGDPTDPRLFYYQALAERGRGNEGKMLELASKAANFNEIDINYALVRDQAQRLLGSPR